MIELVTAAITPAIQTPYELVDVDYGKMGGDYVLSIFVDKEGGISLQDTADLSEKISPILDT
ncbi:ribosome maturation factor RimP, partial [Streptococcus suis]